MVFFELYTAKPRLKHIGCETSRIFHTNSSGMIVVIVYITNGSSIDTLPVVNWLVLKNSCADLINCSAISSTQQEVLGL